MAEVIANSRGYFGGVLRESGDRFNVPDAVMKDAKKRPSWVRPATGKDAAPVKQEAEQPSGDGDDASAKGRGKKAKAETVEAPEFEPFADAPEPVRAQSDINDATGGTQPDWIAPQPGGPTAVAD